jgi:hypothetical protein
MSTIEFENIVETIKKIQSKDIMSLNAIRDNLTQDLGKSPTLQTLINWSNSSVRPAIYNLAKVLNPYGGIGSGLYYYPQVKNEVVAYFNRKTGRKKKVNI